MLFAFFVAALFAVYGAAERVYVHYHPAPVVAA